MKPIQACSRRRFVTGQVIGQRRAIQDGRFFCQQVGMPPEKPVADGGGGEEFAAFQIEIEQPDPGQFAGVGHEIKRVDLIERVGVAGLCPFDQRCGGRFITGPVNVQPLGGPLGQMLLNRVGNAGVLSDLLVLVALHGNDAVAIFFQYLLKIIRRFVPFLQPLHFLGFVERILGGQRIVDVDPLFWFRCVTGIGGLLGDDSAANLKLKLSERRAPGTRADAATRPANPLPRTTRRCFDIFDSVDQFPKYFIHNGRKRSTSSAGIFDLSDQIASFSACAAGGSDTSCGFRAIRCTTRRIRLMALSDASLRLAMISFNNAAGSGRGGGMLRPPEFPFFPGLRQQS